MSSKAEQVHTNLVKDFEQERAKSYQQRLAEIAARRQAQREAPGPHPCVPVLIVEADHNRHPLDVIECFCRTCEVGMAATDEVLVQGGYVIPEPPPGWEHSDPEPGELT